MGTPLKIVHCLRAPVGGLFRHVCDLAREQASRGHAVGIVADSRTGGPSAARALEQLAPVCGLGIWRLPMHRTPGLGDWRVARQVARLARRIRPDVLHGHGGKGGAYSRLAGARTGGKGPLRVYTPHGGSLHYAPRSLSGLIVLALERALLPRTDLLLFESQYARRMFAERVREAGVLTRVVHNGLRPDEFSPVEPDGDAADFVFVGELRDLKGVDVLLQAIARLRPYATAIVFGDGEERPRLAALARELGIDGRVTFAGTAPARTAFARGRCLVVPSRAESLPYIVLEGIAAGLPVVASNVGGIPEILAGQEGWLVPPGDATALAAAMMRVSGDLAAARDKTRTIRCDIMRRFSIEAMTDGVLDAYRAAQDNRPA